ncbi:hypothetical protein [Mesorhizobium sp. M0047]|uniref:hypothetical protein n=1 Tax=Mesorhizobium sp. M0047 TaxID=2956859 RepID=UPI00333BECF3
MAAEAEQLGLIDQEIASAQEMYKKGLERLPRILALQRAQADIRANQASSRAQVAKNDQQIGETKLQLLNLRQQDSESANEDPCQRCAQTSPNCGANCPRARMCWRGPRSSRQSPER